MHYPAWSVETTRTTEQGTADDWGWRHPGPFTAGFHAEAVRAIEEGRDRLLGYRKMEDAGYVFETNGPPGGPVTWDPTWNSPAEPKALRYRSQLWGVSYNLYTRYEFYPKEFWDAMVDQGIKIGLVFPRSTALRYRFRGNSDPVTIIDAMLVHVAEELDNVQAACIALLGFEKPQRSKDLVRLTGAAPPVSGTSQVSAPWLVARLLWRDARDRLLSQALHEHVLLSTQPAICPAARPCKKPCPGYAWY